MSSVVRLCLIGFAVLSVVFGCDTPPDHWNVSHPAVDWNHDNEPEPSDDVDTETQEEIDTETLEDTETAPPEDTETEQPTTAPPEKKSCRESITCLVQNASNPMSCLTQADAEAQKLLMDMITCLTTKGCLKDLQDMQALMTCAMSQCGSEFMACMADT